jgi:hypothetical protein
MRTLRTIVTLAAITALLGPCAARADGLNYSVPEDYYAMKAPALPAGVLFYRGWLREIDGGQHAVVATVRPAPAQGVAVFDELESHLRADGATAIVRAAFDRCGGPGVRVAYVTANRRVHEHVSALAGGRLVAVTYSRPAGAGPDPQAVDSLETLCTGIHQAFGPPSWTRDDQYNANTTVWKAADGSDLTVFGEVQTPEAAQRMIDDVIFPGRITLDAREPCGSITVRHVVSSDDGTTYELISGYLRGFRYKAWYRRPVGTPRDPEIVPVLTSFCAP